MATHRELMTAGVLLKLPRGRARHELVRGVLRVDSLLTEEQAGAASNLAMSLGAHIQGHQLGRAYLRFGCQLESDPDTVRAPETAFIRAERLHGPPRPGYWQGAPDLVAEVASSDDRYGELDEKVATWLEHGARLVLVANPRWRTVMVHRPGQPPRLLTDQDTIDGGDVVPGWRLPVREVFD